MSQSQPPQQQASTSSSANPSPRTNAAAETSNANAATRQRKRRPRKKKSSTTGGVDPNSGEQNDDTRSPAGAAGNQRGQPAVSPAGPKKELTIEQQQQKSKQAKNKKKNNNKKHAWWRKQLPEDAVDPITLDPLRSLQYPPFALVGTEPYEPIDWPPVQQQQQKPATTNGSSKVAAAAAPKISEEERQRRILQEQWGKKVASDDDGDDEKEQANNTDTKKEPPANNNNTTSSDRHVNLFDGRALAYYMVSQLQFIDPLNRRDLTRDELVHLDRYLRRHNFLDLNVTEAYDAKGITLSTAGATAHTAAGRARMLQDEARVLLNALFGGGHSIPRGGTASAAAIATTATNNSNNNINSLMQLYEQHEAAQQQQQQQSHLNRNAATAQGQLHDIGVYGDSAGLVVIDDDENPGLRVSAPAYVPDAAAAEAASLDFPNTLYSARHIVNRYQGHDQRAQEHEFPSLAAVASAARQPPEAPAPVADASKKKVLPKAKTLSKIGSLVKKTDPEELQRQWEAREEARKKALLSNLTFGSNHALKNEPSLMADGFPAQISTMHTGSNAATEAQLERNRAFAEALGVKPSTMRSDLNSGWTRPSEGRLMVDEFGKELNFTQYPESLVVRARENVGVLLKIEKKWKTFLADDTAASLPLNKMDRPTRAFVHEYSDYWNLHTESFDLEPKRYIHCVKLKDTRAPYPLLSEVLQNWRRPVSSSHLDHTSLQTAGQTTRSMPPGPDRVPLTLKPRSTEPVVVDLAAAAVGGVSIGGTRHRSMEEQPDSADKTTGTTGRFSGLADGRERPKLELQKRTVPLELPPFEAQQQTGSFDASEELERQKQRLEAKARRDREEAERHQQALEAAFASDDERERGGPKSDGDSDSDWEEQEAVYVESDDEEA